MAVPKKIINFLEKNKLKYQIIEHKKVYTALDKSATLKVPQKKIGKTIILQKGKELIVVLIAADRNFDFGKFKKIIKNKKIKLASEKMIKNKFKGAKVGAIPPFGSLWKAETFVDKNFKKEKEIILNSGDWRYSIKISPKNLEKIIPSEKWFDLSVKK